MAEAKRPVIYAGGGIVSANAHEELRAFAEKTNIAVATTLMGLGIFPETNPLSMQWFGMHGAAYGNWAVDESDLLLVFGARFDDRITGDTHKFAAHATIVHVDVDASEHNKNKRVNLSVVSDVKYALGRLNELIGAAKFTPPDTSAWHAQIAKWKKEHPFSFEPSRHIQPQEAVQALYELTKGDAIITTGVGQHQMWAAQFYRFNEPRRYISSLGLGAMGFGYPAALGAKVARPDKQVVDIDGDGSFAMNIQELATAHIEKIAAKAMILNNQHLGMVVQWEDRFYGSVRGNTILGDESNVGSPDNPDALYPDFVKIAEGFGVRGRRVIKKSELRERDPGDARLRRPVRPRRDRPVHRARAAHDSGRQDREGDAPQVGGAVGPPWGLPVGCAAGLEGAAVGFTCAAAGFAGAAVGFAGAAVGVAGVATGGVDGPPGPVELMYPQTSMSTILPSSSILAREAPCE